MTDLSGIASSSAKTTNIPSPIVNRIEKDLSQPKGLQEATQAYRQSKGEKAFAVTQDIDQIKEDQKAKNKVGGAGDTFMAGVAGVNKGLAKIPRYLYGLAAAPQNFAADMLNKPELQANYDEVLQASGYQSPLSVIDRLGDLAAGEEDKYNARVKKYNDDITGSISKGNFSDAGAQIVNNIAGSVPSMMLMATTGGIGNAAKLGYYSKTLLNALPFASSKMQELADDKSIPEYIKPVTATLNGLAEVIFDQEFGTQAAIQNIVKLFKEGGKEAAEKAAKELTDGYVKKALKELGAAGKSISKGALEEVTTQFAQNITDKYTVNPNKNLMEGVADAAIVGGLTTGGFEIGGKILAGRYNKNQKDDLTKLAQQRSDIIDDLDKDEVSDEVKNTLTDALKVVESKIDGITEDAEAEIDIMPSQVQAVVTDKTREIEILTEQLQAENLSEVTKGVIAEKIKVLEAEVNNIIDNANKNQEANAIQEPSTESQVSPVGESGQVIPEGSERVGQSQQGKEVTEEVKPQEEVVTEAPKKQGVSREVTDLDIAKSNLKFAEIAKNEATEYLNRYKNNPFADKVSFNKAKLADANNKIKKLNQDISKLSEVKPTEDETKPILYTYNGEKVISEEDLVTKQGTKYKRLTFDNGKNLLIKEKEYAALEKQKELSTQAPPQQTVEQLRAEEQAEYAAMDNPKDKAERQKIYDKYDKLITPLIREEATKAPELSKLDTAKERMATAKAKLKGTKLGIAQDPEQKAKDLFEYHSAIVDVAKEYIKEGVTDAKQFAKEIGEKLTKGVQEAWDEATDKSEAKTLESFTPKKKTVITEPLIIEEETEVETPEQTIRNADVERKREIYGFNKPLEFKKQSNPETIDKAVKAIESGRIKPLDVIEKALRREAITDVEGAIINIYQQNKEAELLKADEEIENLTDSGVLTFEEAVSKRDKIFAELLRSYDASETAGNVSGRALQARKAFLKQDYSLASMIIKSRKANNNEQLTPEKSAEVLKKYKEIVEVKDRLKRRVAFLEDQNNKLKLKDALAPTFKEAELEARDKSRAQTKEQLKIEREGLFKQFNDLIKASRKELSANPIKLEMFPIVAKLAANYFKDGTTSVEGVIDKLYKDLSGSIDGLTKAHLREALVKNAEDTRPTQEELIEDFDEAKKELDSVSKEEVDAKEKARLATYKKSIQKRIDDLSNRIKNKDYSPKAKPNPILLDKEALALQREYAKRKFDFDLDVARDRLAKRNLTEKVIDFTLDKANIPRALLASGDFSAPLRQSLTATISHPIMALKAGKEMFAQAFDAERADNWMYDLKESEGYQLIKDSGLYISDSSNPEVSAKEEDFATNLAEYIPGVAQSERAYSAYLNKMRVDIFSRGVDLLLRDKMTFANNPEAYKSLANFVNASTGRGNLGVLERGSKYLTPLFFSPRFLASRLQLLSGAVLWNAPPAVKKMWLRDMTSTISFGLLVLALFKANGADVEDDPRSSDFGKIRLGDTRWDIWGGFQQPIRYVIQFVSGQKKSSASGKITELDGTNYSKQTRLGVFGSFLRSKLAPIPAMAIDAMAGENMIGERFDLVKNWHKSITPLVWQGTYESANQDGWGFALTATLVPSTFGVGVQSYAVNNFLQKGVDDRSIKLLLSKKATAIEPKEHDKTIYDIKTGEDRKMTSDEFKRYYDTWANYIKNNLKENHSEYASMSNEKFEEKFRKMKTQASILAKETITGITASTKKIEVTVGGEQESYDLTPQEIRFRNSINKEFISKNRNIYTSEFRNQIRKGKSTTEASYIAKRKLESEANSFSKQKILKQHRQGRKYDFND